MRLILTLLLIAASSVITLADAAAATPVAEHDAAWQDYAGLPANRTHRYYYLTSYALPVDLQKAFPQLLAFTCNTLSAKRLVYYPTRLSPTLYRLDFHDFGSLGRHRWDAQAWHRLARLDRYYNNPNTLILRADWWLIYVTDTTLSPAYYDFLYGVGRAPQTADEFERAWRVHLDEIRPLDIETGAVVEDDESIVVKHNRLLARAPTAIGGTYWQTFDFASSVDSRDVFKNLLEYRPGVNSGVLHRGARPANDAGEHIASMPNDHHAFLLTNDQRKRIEFADEEQIAKRRVHNVVDCLSCHLPANGWHPPRNALPDYLDTGRLKSYDKRVAEQIQAFYLTDDGTLLRGDQRRYEAVLVRSYGMSPVELGRAYTELLDWYQRPVDLEQAAKEVGCSPAEFARLIGPVTGALKLGKLCTGTTTINREAWEQDYYLQARAILKAQGVK